MRRFLCSLLGAFCETYQRSIAENLCDGYRAGVNSLFSATLIVLFPTTFKDDEHFDGFIEPRLEDLIHSIKNGEEINQSFLEDWADEVISYTTQHERN